MLRALFFIILAMAIGGRAVWAGNGKKETYPIYINAPDQSIRAHVLAEPVKEQPDLSRTYYWYASNRIMETKGGFDGKLLHGEYALFYLNSNLKEKGIFKKGLKHGKWVSWYDNGQLKDITIWNNGKRDGMYRSFNELGQPVLEARFRNDELHGKLTSYEKGKQLSSKKYHRGEEVTRPPKKQRVKKMEKDSTRTKEGINTVTPKENSEKPSFKERLRAFFKKDTSAVEAGQEEKQKKEKEPAEKTSKRSREKKVNPVVEETAK